MNRVVTTTTTYEYDEGGRITKVVEERAEEEVPVDTPVTIE